MNKKVLYSILVIILFILIVGSIVFIYKKNTKDDNSKTNSEATNDNITQEEGYVGYAYKIGYVNETANIDTIITDLPMFEEYFKNYNIKFDKAYDEEYFKNHNLAVKYIITSSSGDVITYKGSSTLDNLLVVKYDLDTSKGITDDMSGYFIIVECPKNIEKVID